MNSFPFSLVELCFVRDQNHALFSGSLYILCGYFELCHLLVEAADWTRAEGGFG